MELVQKSYYCRRDNIIMKIARFLDNCIYCISFIFGLTMVVKLLISDIDHNILYIVTFVILVVIMLSASFLTSKGLKKTGRLLFDLSTKKTFGGYKNYSILVFSIRIIALALLVVGCILLLVSDFLDDAPLYLVVYVNPLLNKHYLNYAVHEQGIQYSNRFCKWSDISGIILNPDNSLELRLRGSTPPATLYYDIKQHSEIAEFLKGKFNENLFIDKKA
jgi:hypothetical protein